MTYRILLLAVLGAGGAMAQLAPPLLALVTDGQQQIRRAYGVTGNFILGDAVEPRSLGEVVNWAFSGGAGLVKTADQLLLLSADAAIVRSSPAPAGNAQFAFDADGRAALVFLAEPAELWRIGTANDIRTTLDPSQIDGDVRAIAFVGQRRATLAICRGNSLWLTSVDLAGGSVVSRRPAYIAGCPALALLPDRLIYATPGSLVIRSIDGEEHRVKLPEPAKSLRLIGDGWLEIATAHDSLALRLDGESGTLYRFPGAPRK
jgi:hypothetical protein